MNKKIKRILSSLLSCVAASVLCFTSTVITFPNVVAASNEVNVKITSSLLEKYRDLDSTDAKGDLSDNTNSELPVLIWCSNDVDYDKIYKESNLASLYFSTSSEDSMWLSNDKNDVANFDDTTAEIKRYQAAIEAERKLSEQHYSELNIEYADKYLSSEDVIYVSKYSPVILANLTYEEVKDLAKSPDTDIIDCYDSTCEAEMNVSIPVMRANEVQSYFGTYGFTGSGIKIGQAEPSVPDVTSAQLSSISSRIYRNSTTYIDNHATMVASIMVGQATSSLPAGVAPGATLYSASTSAAGGWMQAIEWLLSQGVNVINASMAFGGDGYNNYGTTAQWVDHIAINHSVHFVKSAGNSGSTGVTSGGMSYNGFAIGNIDDKNTTSLSDDILRSTSSYSTSSSSTAAFKPDLCAPGTNITTSVGSNSGTSFAAPHTAATIALLCQEKPQLLTLQDAVKAILTASVNPNSPYKYCPSSRVTSPTGNCYTQFGAGLLDSYRATWITMNTRYNESSLSSSQTSKTFYMNVTSSDTHMRVSLAYLKYNSITSSSHTSNPSIQYTMPNLNLYIYDPSGNLVASSTTTNNVEIAEFVPKTYGTYSIKVEKASSPSTSATTYFGISWL